MGVTGVMGLFLNDLADHTTFVTSVMGVMEIAGRFLMLLPPGRGPRTSPPTLRVTGVSHSLAWQHSRMRRL